MDAKPKTKTAPPPTAEAKAAAKPRTKARAKAAPPAPKAARAKPSAPRAPKLREARDAVVAPEAREAPEARGVEDEIRALEERLDAIIEEGGAPREPEPSAELDAPSLPPAPTAFDLAREGRHEPPRRRTAHDEVDDFGYDPAYDARTRGLFDFLYDRYFRVECRGAANVPNEGRCMLVANHSGTIPFDGPMLKTAVQREHPAKRQVRWLAEDFVFHFPFLGSFETRIGAVRACQENAERLLRQETLLAVFPEGTKGIGKLFRDRYQLQRFGRGGFVRLALRTQTPIVPVAIVGGEETNPMLLRLESIAKPLGVPYVPITPTFPLLGPLGLLPAPTKWKMIFGEPISVAEHGAESEHDELLVARLAERVRGEIQSMLDAALRDRKSVLFG